LGVGGRKSKSKKESKRERLTEKEKAKVFI
jgi:hypothetical protein